MTQDWMLNGIAAVPGVRCVVALSSDGLVTAQTAGIDRDQVDTLAAACSGLQAISQGLVTHFAPGDLQHLTIAYSDAVLFVRSGGERSHLAAWADRDANPGLVTQAMQVEINRMGKHNLSTPARQPENTTSQTPPVSSVPSVSPHVPSQRP